MATPRVLAELRRLQALGPSDMIDWADRLGISRSHLNKIYNGLRPITPNLIKDWVKHWPSLGYLWIQDMEEELGLRNGASHARQSHGRHQTTTPLARG